MAVNNWISAGSNDGNLAANWSLGALAATDVLTFDNAQSTVTCNCSAAWTCAGINMTAGFTGTVNLSTYSHVCTGSITLQSTSTFTPSSSLVTLSGTAAQTITSNGKSFYDITINRTTAGTCLFADATSCHTLTASATNTQAISWTGTTMTCSGNLTLDGSGTHNMGNAITMAGASSQAHWGNTLTGVTAGSCILTMTTSTNGIIDDDKGVFFKSLSGTGVITNSGAQASTYTTALTPLTLGNSTTLTVSRAMNFILTSSGNFYTLGTSSSIAGAAAVNFKIGANNVAATCPAMVYTGSYGIVYSDNAAYTGWSITLSGTQSIGGGDFAFTFTSASSGTVDFNNQTVTSNDLYCGTSNAGGVITINYTGSSINIRNFMGASYNAGTTNDNFSTSVFVITGNWTFGSNHTITGTVATQSVTFTNTATITSNGKVFPGNKIVNAAGKTITKADAVSIAGNLTVTAGTLAGAFSTTCAGDVTVMVSVTFNRLILTKATTRTLTVNAGTTLTLTNLVASDFSGVAGALTRIRSFVPGVRFTMAIPNAVTLTFFDSQDCAYSGFNVTANDGTSVTGGNNLRYLTFNSVSVTPITGSKKGGTLLTFTDTGNGCGGTCTVTVGGGATASPTVVNSQHLTALTMAGTPGVASIVVTNGDGDTRTLVGAFTYLDDSMSGGPSRCYISSAIGI